MIQQLKARLNNMVLDGGFSTQLEANGYDLNHALWSAKVLIENPDAIVQVHKDYIEAGANCVITASYQATVAGFTAMGLSEQQARSIIAGSVTLAKQAVEEQDSDCLVAASVGPYGAALADGSEYTGYSDQVSYDQLKTFHQERWRLLWQAGPDLMACETIPSPLEIKVLADLATECQSPFWLTVTCKDGAHIADGTAVVDALAGLADHPYLVGWGVNCTAPEYVTQLVTAVKSLASDVPVVVYPNSGQVYDPVTKTWSGNGDPTSFADYAKQWRAAGAGAIGGCCQTLPAHMAAVKQTLG